MIKKLALVVGILPVLASATSLHPDTFRRDEVSKVLKALNVENVGREGAVLRTNRRHPYTSFLIGIPAEVATASACVDFVGQETTVDTGRVTQLRAMGASDPLNEACIEIYPMPVPTQLTITMNVLTGGFVPAQRYHQQLVNIHGAGLYLVTLDLHEERVTIRPNRRPFPVPVPVPVPRPIPFPAPVN